MSEENVELARRTGDNFNAFMQGELSSEAFAEPFDPQIEVHWHDQRTYPDTPQHVRGIPELIGFTEQSKLDRLSRSMLDFTALMAQAQKQSWALVALDCAVDTTTPAGEAMANVLATFAQFERRLIGQRTRDALREKKAQGIRLGRPVELPAPVVKRIKRERDKGATLAAIAEGLNSDGVPTAHGGDRWWPSTVRAILNRA